MTYLFVLKINKFSMVTVLNRLPHLPESESLRIPQKILSNNLRMKLRCVLSTIRLVVNTDMGISTNTVAEYWKHQMKPISVSDTDGFSFFLELRRSDDEIELFVVIISD